MRPITFSHPSIPLIGQRMREAKTRGAARILMMGAHVLRAGTQLHLIDLMERGLISLIAMNGAGPIHDWEFALIGASTESVARYVSSGEFGLWEETGRMNDAVTKGVKDGMGLGESIGRVIAEGFFPHKHASVLAAAYRLKIPVTVHIGIGYDIIHEHPNADGGVLGRASYTDFLVFAEHIRKLEGGIVLNFGTRGDGAGSVSQGPGDGPQRRASTRRTDREVHHSGLRPHPSGRRFPHPGSQDRSARTTFAPGKRSSCEPSPMVARASTFRAITGTLCPPSGRRRLMQPANNSP